MTGLYPLRHGVRANGTFRLEDKITTLAERLKSKGYRTAAVISAFVLDSRFGLDQGFDLYHDDLTKGMQYSDHMFRERAAELTNEPVYKVAARQRRWDPFSCGSITSIPTRCTCRRSRFAASIKHNPYDGEIAYADSQIGALLSQLEELGVQDQTLVVYTSDHGEGLGEHGEQTHSLLVYDATLHVPMILHAPAGIPLGKLLHRQTCLTDVVPTLLHSWVRICPEVWMETICVQPPAESTETGPDRDDCHHDNARLGAADRRASGRLQVHPCSTPELYDLVEDPRELKNLHDDIPDLVKELRTQLVSWLGDDPYLAEKGGIELENIDVDEVAMRKLAALGYIQDASELDKEATHRLDPKDMVLQWEMVQQAINKQAAGNNQDAIPMLEACVAEVPGDNFARSSWQPRTGNKAISSDAYDSL